MEQQWYYLDSNGRNGPVSLRDLTTILSKFPSAAELLVWHEGLQDWTRAGDIPALDSFTRTPPTLSEAIIATQPPVWKVRWWWLVFAIAFPGVIGSRDGRRMMAWQSAERRKARRARQPRQRENALPDPNTVDEVSKSALSSVPSWDRTPISEHERETSSHGSPVHEPMQSSSLPPAKIPTTVSILSGSLNAVLVLMTIGGGLLGLVLYIFMNASGPNLKVWTQEVYLDPKATKPILVLNIQSRNDTPVVLTDVSVNENPKCMKYETTTPGLMMELILNSQGISVQKDGYSRELKLGEIEKLSLGSPSFGGCTPVKVVITTDHGYSTFNFE